MSPRVSPQHPTEMGQLRAYYSGNVPDSRIFNPRDVTHMTPPLA
jgi:hypothetical protein